jgi:hypothetical protein
VQHGAATAGGVLGPDRPRLEVALGEASRLRQFLDYAREGVWHIWIGIDHVLFLVSLLLPAVLVYGAGGWGPAQRFAPVFWEVFRVVTAFTVALSVTLSVAALGLVELPSRLVESMIALSVVLAALNNLKPWCLRGAGRWLSVGLVRRHFASARDLATARCPAVSLVGFNLAWRLTAAVLMPVPAGGVPRAPPLGLPAIGIRRRLGGDRRPRRNMDGRADFRP